MSLNILNNLDKILSCPICFEAYNKKEKRPLAFDCKHVLCEKCSIDLTKNNYFDCPFCHKVTHIKTLKDLEASFDQLYDIVLATFYDQVYYEKTPETLEKKNEVTTKDNFSYIKNDLNNIKDLRDLIRKINQEKTLWKNIKLKIAFLGKTKAGKSTLINTLRGLAKNSKNNNNKNEDFAPTDVVQCTTIVKGYKFKENENILLCDIPGAGTIEYKTNDEFLNSIEFDTYDFFVLMITDALFLVDEWLLKKILESKKPFVFVYTKIDTVLESYLEAFENYSDMDEDERNLQRTIKMDLVREEYNTKLKKILNEQPFDLFFISCFLSKRTMYEYDNFNKYLLSKLPYMKKNMLTLAIKPLSDKIILEKVDFLTERINTWKNSFKGFGVLKKFSVALFNYFENYLHNFLAEEIDFYKKAFCLDEEILLKSKNHEIKEMINKYNDLKKYIDTSIVDKTIYSESSKLDENEIERKKKEKLFFDNMKNNQKSNLFQNFDFEEKIAELLINVVSDMQTAAVMIMSQYSK